MKILVIGSTGQLGTDCMNIMRERHDITGIDYPDIDIGSRNSIEKVFKAAAPEVIINCAAYTAVDNCETEREVAWKINADGPRHIAEIVSPTGCKIVHISTDYVFDGTKEVPGQYLEDDPVNPLSEYGRNKLAGEQATLKYAPNSLILRTAWLYSAYGQNFLKTMLRLALSDPDRQFTIVNDQFGSLTWSHTLARQIEKLLKARLSGVVHATSDGYSSWYEAACYFLDKMEIPHSFTPCTTADYPTAAHRPANSILKNKVLDDNSISVFGSWQEHVDRFVDTFRDTLIDEVQSNLAR